MNLGALAAALLVATSIAFLGASAVALALRLAGRTWQTEGTLIKLVYGLAGTCWVAHVAAVLEYGSQYGVWAGLVGFTAASVTIAALLGTVARAAAAGRPAVVALLPFVLGLYWVLTFPLLRWHFPEDYFSTDDLGQGALTLACLAASLFLAVYLGLGRRPAAGSRRSV